MNSGLPMSAVVASCLVGCITDAGEQVPLLDADYQVFVGEVQPILDRRCSNPSCHGSMERPLEIFSVHQHRLDPLDVYLDLPLSDDELRRNFDRARVFLDGIETPERSLLLLKPLLPEAGGASHVGGTQFESTADYEYQVLYAWIDDALSRKEP